MKSDDIEVQSLIEAIQHKRQDAESKLSDKLDEIERQVSHIVEYYEKECQALRERITELESSSEPDDEVTRELEDEVELLLNHLSINEDLWLMAAGHPDRIKYALWLTTGRGDKKDGSQEQATKQDAKSKKRFKPDQG